MQRPEPNCPPTGPRPAPPHRCGSAPRCASFASPHSCLCTPASSGPRAWPRWRCARGCTACLAVICTPRLPGVPAAVPPFPRATRPTPVHPAPCCAHLPLPQTLQIMGCCHIPAYFAQALCSMQQARALGGAWAGLGLACGWGCGPPAAQLQGRSASPSAGVPASTPCPAVQLSVLKLSDCLLEAVAAVPWHQVRRLLTLWLAGWGAGHSREWAAGTPLACAV